MPDLHDWITQQIDKVEVDARAAEKDDGRHWTEQWDERSDAFQIHDSHGIPVAYGLQPGGAGLIVRHDPAAVLRRCEADRRILNRHHLDPDVHFEPACKGCGTYGDVELSNTDNLNECPELLDLAHAHGLTPEILATLDQPVPPPMPERPEPVAFRIGPPGRPTSSVPPGLRGPNWKA